MVRKLVSVLLVLSLVLGLVGCGAKDIKDSTPETKGNEEVGEANVPEVETEEQLEYVELDWVVRLDGVGHDLELIQEKLDEYFLEKLNCKVNLINLEDYFNTVSTTLLAGEDVDLVFLLAQDYFGLASQGALLPLNELLAEHGANAKGMFNDDVWDAVKYEGQIYAVPTLRDNAYINGVIYNSTMADALGLDIENQDFTYFADVAEYAIEVKEIRDQKYPELADKPLMNEWGNIVPYAFAFEQFASLLAGCNVPGLEVDPAKGTNTVFSVYETEAYKDYVLLTHRAMKAGVVPADGEEPVPNDAENFMFCPAWGQTYIDKNFCSPEFETKLLTFEDALWMDTEAFTIACTGIAANSKNPERAMMVLDALCSDPYLATLCRFGIEGVHWEYDADGKMQFAGANAENKSWLNWYGIYNPNLIITEGPESYVGPDRVMVDRLGEYIANSTVAANMGFVFNSESVANEIAACNSVVAEYDALNRGLYNTEEETLEALDMFISKLKANGLDRIIAEAQAQLDAFWASK